MVTQLSEELICSWALHGRTRCHTAINGRDANPQSSTHFQKEGEKLSVLIFYSSIPESVCACPVLLDDGYDNCGQVFPFLSVSYLVVIE